MYTPLYRSHLPCLPAGGARGHYHHQAQRGSYHGWQGERLPDSIYCLLGCRLWDWGVGCGIILLNIQVSRFSLMLFPFFPPFPFIFFSSCVAGGIHLTFDLSDSITYYRRIVYKIYVQHCILACIYHSNMYIFLTQLHPYQTRQLICSA